MIHAKNPAQRSTAAGITAAALLLACVACSTGGGGLTGGTTTGAGSGSVSDAASHYGNTGGSLEDACAAFDNVNQDSGNGAEQATVAQHWDGMAKSAPAEIADKVYVVAQAQDKLAAGDPSGLTDEAVADVHDITQWWLANCNGSGSGDDNASSPAPADDGQSGQTSGGNPSADALCSDLEGADLESDSDEDMAAGLELWHQMVTDAPSDIRAAVQKVSEGLDKAAAGDPSVAQSDAWAQAIGQVSTWEIANCQG